MAPGKDDGSRADQYAFFQTYPAAKHGARRYMAPFPDYAIMIDNGIVIDDAAAPYSRQRPRDAARRSEYAWLDH